MNEGNQSSFKVVFFFSKTGSLPLIACQHIKTGDYYTYTCSIHTDVMSDMVLENTLHIKCIFEQTVLLSLFDLGVYIFFFYLFIKL